MIDSLENLTGRLREKRPVLNDPGALTEQIMQRIAAQEVRAKKRPFTPRMHRFSDPLFWIRTSLSTAAALLVLVLLTQNMLAESSVQQNIPVTVSENLLPPAPASGVSTVNAYRMHLLKHTEKNRIFEQHLHPQKQNQ